MTSSPTPNATSSPASAFGPTPAGVSAPHIRDRTYWVAHANSYGRKSRGKGRSTVGYRATAESDRSAGRLGHPDHQGRKDTPGKTAQRNGTDRVDQLPRQAYLCGWPTPLATDGDKADATLPVVLKRIEQMGHMAAFMRAECSAEHICTPPGIDLSSH